METFATFSTNFDEGDNFLLSKPIFCKTNQVVCWLCPESDKGLRTTNLNIFVQCHFLIHIFFFVKLCSICKKNFYIYISFRSNLKMSLHYNFIVIQAVFVLDLFEVFFIVLVLLIIFSIHVCNKD